MPESVWLELDAASWEGMKWDDKTFLEKYGAQPLIIRNFRKVIQDEEITEDLLKRLLPPTTFSVYTGDVFLDLKREEFMEHFLRDDICYNLLEGLSPPDDEMYSVPSFYSENWYSGSPYPLNSMVCSSRLSYSKMHTDPAGSGAWMLLLCGEKRWTITPPAYRSTIYSPQTRFWWDPRAPHEETKALLPFCEMAPSYSIDHRGGDLLWVPPGWPHRVLTTKRAIAVGSFYLHPLMSPSSASSFVADKSFGLPDGYLAHPNFVELDEKKAALKYSSSHYAVEGRDPHFVEVLNTLWLKNPEVMGKYEKQVREAERRLLRFKSQQEREAHVYPEEARVKDHNITI